MPRILTDLPDDDLAKLDALATRRGTSRAATIREAVKLYLAERGDDRGWIERGYGLWAGRDDAPDGVQFQRAIREDRAGDRDV
ncbi:CopG family ribbon-helix-helix protein [Tsuneonella sp. SYSU-LHT278]|uniref:CopG family ribbon-helix-helix protein n=1 Tax=Tsuneonella sediminis TaxID=3416089 RepID=UPI003F7ACCDA